MPLRKKNRREKVWVKGKGKAKAHEASSPGKKGGRKEMKGSNGCKKPCPSFHFLSSPCVPKMALLNHKMLQRSPLNLPCVWHRSGCGSLTPIVTLTVCCGVPVINSCRRQPPSHMFSGGTQKEAEREWHLKFWENRVAQRDCWWKALRNLRGIEKGWTISFQRHFFVLCLWCNWKELRMMMENRIDS